jgi:Flp pilus assembly secretin CpaC
MADESRFRQTLTVVQSYSYRLNSGQESVVVVGLLQSNTHSNALSDGDEDSFE